MTTADPPRLSSALSNFLEEGSDEDSNQIGPLPIALGLGDLDITTVDTSLRGERSDLIQTV